jgi:hypothetical protein
MAYSTQSSLIALFANLKIEHILNPWKIIVDIEQENITVEKRNWFLIGNEYNTVAFRFIRSVSINEHVFGADITIKVFGNTVTAYYISKKAAKAIRELLLIYNQGNNSPVIFT